MYAHLNDDKIVIVFEELPSQMLIDDVWHELDGMSNEELASIGIHSVVETPKPSDELPVVYLHYTVELVEGVPTQVWVPTELSPEEADQKAQEDTAQVTENNIDSKIVTVDLPAMQAVLDQTNAQLREDPAQELKAMARAIRRIDKKLLHILLEGSE